MYEEFFGLSEKPFSIQPDPSFLYWGRGHRLAYAMLEYGVLNHAGISVVTGDVGCGKTTLIHRLLDQLSDTHSVALLSNIQAGRGDLLSWVLMGFGQPFAGKSHVELFSQLQSFFIGEYAKGKRVVLIIDEAQNLSMDMLEELRMLSNINAGKDQLLQLILVGQPQLKDLLNRPEMLQLAQRVGSDFHLTPLNPKEVREYLDTRLTIAGCRRRVFTDRAVELIAEQSRGVPRVINIIADTALVYAFSAEELVVGVEIIRNVVRDKIDYGVFGLASDERRSEPLAAEDAQGPVAFIGSEIDADVSALAAAKAAQAPAMPQTGFDVEANAAGQDEPAASAVNGFDADEAAAPEMTSSPAPVMERAPAPDATEQQTGPATGVIIVGGAPAISAELLMSAIGEARPIVYVPRDPEDPLIAGAGRAGVAVADFNPNWSRDSIGRARNAGYRKLKSIAPDLTYAQFIDAGAALESGWIDAAEQFLERREEVSVIEGGNAVGNADLPPFLPIRQLAEKIAYGEAASTGECFMIRAESFEKIGGYRGDLAAAETKDLCVRLRRRGLHIWRIEAPMLKSETRRWSLADWWATRKTAGFENAYAASLHGGAPERVGVSETMRATIWGCFVPVGLLTIAVVAAFIAGAFSRTMSPLTAAGSVVVVGLLIYTIRYLGAVIRRGVFSAGSWSNGFYAVFGVFPEFFGVLKNALGGARKSAANG